MSENSKQTHQQETMVRGMAWLTAGNFISRLLGLIYVIPWFIWMGEHRNEANALFNMGYQVYATFLLISTIGLPTAMAKQIAKYNALERRDISYYLVREFFKLMLILGFIFATMMYLFSPTLAAMSGSKEQLTPVMYSLVPPILIFPAMSIMRGFFQGHNNMKPYAISQIAEQIARLIWIWGATFFIMKIGSGDYLQAVVQSTFGAFIGMIASIAVLLFALQKGGYIAQVLKKPESGISIDLKSLIIETTKEAIPLIVIGSAIQLYQLVDQVTFVNFMRAITNFSKQDLLVDYSYMISNPSKITMVIIGVAGSIGSVAIPMITEKFVKKDIKGTSELIVDNIRMLAMVVIPAIVGTIILARPLYIGFYGASEPAAIGLFRANLLLIFFQALYTLFGVVIQGIFENRKGIIFFVAGLVVKIVLHFPFIYLFHAYGPLLSTAAGLFVSNALIFRRVDKVVGINKQAVLKNILGITLLALIMGTIVFVLEFGLSQILPPVGRVESAIHLVLAGSVGVLVYAYLTLKTRQLDRLIGVRADILRQKLHIR